jgi:glycine/D-amino acid oxidase-like deaminating enzyme
LVIVGAGLIGVSVALRMAEAGVRTVVIDRGRIGAGASGRNAGLLLPGTAELFHALVARWGREAAKDLWELAVDGARRLAEWVERREIECHWRAEGALHVAVSAEQAARLRASARTMADIGLDALWLDRAALQSRLDRALPAALRGALQTWGGALHPGLLVTGLASQAAHAGAVLVEDVTAQFVEAAPGSVTVHTSVGRVRADWVLIATNAAAADVVPELAGMITPVRGQVICLARAPRLTLRGAWSLNDGFEYFQQLPDGRIVVGGMRWSAADLEVGLSRPHVNPAIAARLQLWFEGLFPDLGPASVERRWAGIMDWTADRLPLLGPSRESQRVILAVGLNGHGLPFATLAADMVHSTVTGVQADDRLSLLSPRRMMA